MATAQQNFRLTIELVPATTWGENLRSGLRSSEWDLLRKDIYKQAGYKCQICGGKGPKWPVEAHELWDFDDVTHVQTLKGLIALCPKCHGVKHLGRHYQMGHAEPYLFHLAKVNGISFEEAMLYFGDELKIWQRRSQFQWTLDISWAITRLEELSYREESTGYFDA